MAADLGCFCCFTFWPSRAEKIKAPRNVEEVDVVVLGAGFAGLACGLALAEQGHRVRILEARDRPGGRTFSVPVKPDASQPVLEYGGEFIHGEKVRTWHYMARFGMEACNRGNSPIPGTSVLKEGKNYVYVNGKLLAPDDVSKEPNTMFFESMDQAAARWIAEGGDPTISLLDLMKERPDHIFGRLPPTEDEIRLCNGMLAEWYASDLDDVCVNEACPVDELLALVKQEPNLLEDDGEEGHWRVKAGYSALAQCMADLVEIDYGHEVQKVSWGEQGAEVAVKCGAQVHKVNAKHAVVTIPLACLQRNDVEFSPPLPEAKKSAIQQIGSGDTFKVVLIFERSFWPEDLQFLLSPMNLQIWWPGPPGSNALLAYTGGAQACKELLSRSDADIVAEGLKQLKQIFHPLELPPLKSGFVPLRWPEDPWARMAYSYNRRGCPADARIRLRDPCGSLAWAGEACHPTKNASVHGALESGEYAANWVNASLGGLTIVDLREAELELLERVYDELVQPNFPVEGELDDIEDLRKNLLNRDPRCPEQHVLVARTAGEKPTLAACVCYEYYIASNIALISYIVVAEPFRKTGLSKRMLRCLEAQLAFRCRGKPIAPIVAETHEATVTDGIMDPRLRHDVLAKLGFRCLQFNFVQPPLSPAQKPCGGLHLLVKDRDHLPSQQLVSFLDEYAGSILDWNPALWKSEPYFQSQIQQLSRSPVVKAIAERPW